MKQILLCVLLISTTATFTHAQDTTAASSTYENGKAFLRKGDLDNAIMLFTRASQQQPNNVNILKDLTYAYYMRKDYRNGLETGKKLIERPDADDDCYQLLGLCYKATAAYSDCEKLYKKGLARFPKSGILYSETGDLLAVQHKLNDAIKYWEKGIEIDPNNGNNYLNAAHYYDQQGNLLWAVLYGEIFINIESLTDRTASTKVMLADDYKQLFSSPALLNGYVKQGTPFTRAIAGTFATYSNLANDGVTPDALNKIRTKFTQDWTAQYAKQYPFRLFDHFQQLVQQNTFEAYNQWIFNSATNESAYNTWVSAHTDSNSEFVKLQRSRVFKIPAGQYYAH
ncbi:tetratricopeptide repeat protein [Deminuibacter soli]|nr:hypothetical protein [Deminuibacter soli]